MKKKFIILSTIILLLLGGGIHAFAENKAGDFWYASFGGGNRLGSEDYFQAVIAVEDGIVAVGGSYTGSFGHGVWIGIKAKGSSDTDAMIVKYDYKGDVIWYKAFGADKGDSFSDIAPAKDGYLAVGFSQSDNNGDWKGVKSSGGDDGILVKYSTDGKVLWQKRLAFSGSDYINAVKDVQGGFMLVGYCTLTDGRYRGVKTGNGDLKGLTSKSAFTSALIMKVDQKGKRIWTKVLGGYYQNQFNDVISVSDGYVAVGRTAGKESNGGAFANVKIVPGDWKGIEMKGDDDATIVKYDGKGKVLWKYAFGGSGLDEFRSVAEVKDGYIAVGYCEAISFGNGDLKGLKSFNPINKSNLYQNPDCVIAKFSKDGKLLWKKILGSGGYSMLTSVQPLPEGFIVAGLADLGDMGELKGTVAVGRRDGIVAKFKDDGTMFYSKAIGSVLDDYNYNSVDIAVLKDGYVVVGDAMDGIPQDPKAWKQTWYHTQAAIFRLIE